jgi:hypothetical protein
MKRTILDGVLYFAVLAGFSLSHAANLLRASNGEHLWLKTEWIEEVDNIRDLIKKVLPVK